MSVTAIILTFNEEQHITRCIASLKPVVTRIVVIEKQSDPAAAQNLAERQRDYTGVEDIGELFDRLEDLMLPKRTGVVEADAAPATRAEQVAVEEFARLADAAADPGAGPGAGAPDGA